MKNSSRKNQGFTLVEVVISLTLGAMLIGVSYTMIITLMKMNKKSGERQLASYYGQQIIEKLKSADISKTLSGDRNSGYKIIFDGIELSENSNSNSYSGQYELKNFDSNSIDNLTGYIADITITRNESGIGAGQKQVSSTVANIYTLQVNGSGRNANIKIDNKESDELMVKKDGEYNYFEIDVDVEKGRTSKKVYVNKENIEKGKYEKEFFNNEPIRFNLDFSNYDFNFEGEKEVSNPQFRIIIRNNDDKDLNLCIQKSNLLETRVYVENDSGEIEDADIVVDTKKGGCKVYNNRLSFETASNIGNLYDISVIINKNEKEVFRGSASQNLKIYDATEGNN
ncbi:MAG TPA: hypothetical protein DG753_07100 [Clostridium sp.]|nr:hypothetical protein [Clostridium sp.]